MYRSALFILVTFTIVSCEKEYYLIQSPEPEIIQEEPQSDIPTQLLPYFLSFQQEASNRGIQFDYEDANVTAEIRLINDGNVAGTCTTNGHTLRHIVIDQAFWNRASHLLKEMIIYHELGHCILGRGHEEGAFPNGVCRSIMRSGLGSCRDAYTTANRAYFVSELFDLE